MDDSAGQRAGAGGRDGRQEQTLSFVPKIVAMILVLSFTLPWVITFMVQYSSDLISGIPGNL